MGGGVGWGKEFIEVGGKPAGSGLPEAEEGKGGAKESLLKSVKCCEGEEAEGGSESIGFNHQEGLGDLPENSFSAVVGTQGRLQIAVG